MGRKLPPLNALKAFEAAARHLNFNKAAQELCVTQGAVSRQIQILEKHFGTELFWRRARSLELTDQGHLLFPSTQYALDELEKAARRIKGVERSKTLTVSSSPTLAQRWLYPRLFRFNEKVPDIEIRTIITAQPVDFSREDVDVAIRIGRNDPTDYITGPRINHTATGEPRGIRAVRLMEDRSVPVCSPAFLKEHGPVLSLGELDEDQLIHMTSRKDAWADWCREEGQTPPSRHKHVYGHFFLAIDAALRGLGVALVPLVHVHDDIVAGRLVVPFNRVGEQVGAYYFLCRADQWNAPKVQAFRKWIMAESQEWAVQNTAMQAKLGSNSSATERSRHNRIKREAAAEPAGSAPAGSFQ